MNGDVGERSAAYSGVVGGLAQLEEDGAEALASQLVSARRILDVGAGSGVWSLAMTRRSTETPVTGVDLPDVLPVFLRRAEALDLAERADAIAGDYHALSLPSRAFDRVVLANVLHLEPEDRARALVRRVTDALDANGDLVIVDAFGRPDVGLDRARPINALHLAMRTRGARAHRAETVESWCREAGLARIQRVELEPIGLLANRSENWHVPHHAERIENRNVERPSGRRRGP